MPACYVSPELLALAEIEAEQFGGISPATRKLWENYFAAVVMHCPKTVTGQSDTNAELHSYAQRFDSQLGNP
jgi:hypothetical protein